MRQSTLLFLLQPDDSKVLLGMKKRGFGQGKYNGFGGKVEANESITQAVIREAWEEAQVVPAESALKLVGRLEFIYPANPDYDQEVFVHTCHRWEGNPQETEEMKPCWFSFAQIPYQHMWQDDSLWLPQVLAGKWVEARVVFARDNEQVAQFEEVGGRI